jgi:hypothetical protein
MDIRMLFAAAGCAVVLTAFGQGTSPPPVADLPDASKPNAPADTRLPGPDPRRCGTSKYSALCAAGRWSQFSKMSLHVKVAGFTGDYAIEAAGNGDQHATYREEVAGRRRGGEVLLIGREGVAYRTRDELPEPDDIVDYLLSTSIMMSRLAAVLLDLGALGPPADVGKSQAIGAESKTQFLRAEAPRTATLYGPPWRMTGTVQRTSDDQIAFTLRLRFKPVDAKGRLIPGKTDAMEIAGTVSYVAPPAAFPESMDLAGWTLMKGTAPMAKATTLGEARSSLGYP